MRCPVQGKTCHKTKSDAIQHLNNLERRNKRKKSTVYFCKHCSAYHITRSIDKSVIFYQEKKRKLLHEREE
jgi:hypothetical protein